MDSNQKPETKSALCNKHGQYVSTKIDKPVSFGLKLSGPDWTMCPTCKSDRKLELKAKEASESNRERQEMLDNKLKHAGIPKKFRSKSFDNIVVKSESHQAILNQCKRYAERFEQALKFGTSLILYGKPGTGKNHIAYAIANIITQSRYTSATVRHRLVCDEIKLAFQKNKTEIEMIRGYVEPDLLIINEIGLNIDDKKDYVRMNELIDFRYDENKCTIMLTNLDMNDSNDDGQSIKSVLGDRIVSRLYEGSGRAFMCDWSDHRPKIKNHELWD